MQPEVLTTPDDLTQTDAFRRWFGASKAVDDDGRPLVVYHGSNRPLEQVMSGPERLARFDANTKDLPRSVVEAERRQLEKVAGAVWFTDDEWVAQGYAGQCDGVETVTAVYVSMQNPLDLLGASVEEVEQVLSAARGCPVSVSTEYGRRKGIAHAIVHDNGSLIQYAIAQGFDGLIYPDTDVRGRSTHVSYVTFEPGQVKAVANVGAFDSQDPRVAFKRAASASCTTDDDEEDRCSPKF
ncbi:ADP-ribosyltransferase-containing protein [Pseudoxanthomonas kaohsiungensis]|uniref:ART-PolyVal-like domain-containing protein n=1 Tax=Pseudoxanthomonas kaohsiungensis TaxID=283923 RepID=A0ABW3LXI8_9GAMM|nr:hypothetical protein [Pseudoxanthomonas kaohsiungensis]KAF1702897.1 hypothetical protein CSC66_08980 [Pseudoxanthomonas kaohsiungensis]